jgi:hypothetical protein
MVVLKGLYVLTPYLGMELIVETNVVRRLRPQLFVVARFSKINKNYFVVARRYIRTEIMLAVWVQLVDVSMGHSA